MKEGKVFKRILAIALVVVMTITMVPFGVFAAEGEGTEHEHVWSTSWTGGTDSTCAVAGHKGYFACTVEGCDSKADASNKLLTSIEKPLDANNHASEETEVKNAKDATCTEKGYTGDTVYKCCGAVKTAGTAIDEIAHTLKTIKEDQVEATCGKDGGYKSVTLCSVCGYVESTVDVVDPATGDHNYTTEKADTKVEATCTTAGKVVKVCACGAEKEETINIDPTAHKFIAEGKCEYCNTPCTHDWDDGVCEVCGKVCGHTGGTATCTEKATCATCGDKYGEVNAENHASNETEVKNAKDATCTEKGYTGDTCYKCCGAVKTAGTAIDEIAHSYTVEVTASKVASTCKTKGSVDMKCATCDAKEKKELDLDATNHEGFNKEVEGTKTPATCVATGSVKMECACGDRKTVTLDIDNTAHDLDDLKKLSDAEHGKACKREGCTYVADKAAHAYTETVSKTLPTCVTKGSETKKCVCGETKTEVLDENDNHDWGAYSETKAPTCTDKGEKERACKREGCAVIDKADVDALGHDMDEVAAKEATCEEAGNNKYYACDRCKKFFEDEAGALETTVADQTIAKGDHKFTKYNVVKDGTCTANGVEKATCDICEEATHERAMPGTMIAHTFKDYKSNGDATCKVDGTMTAVCDMCKEAKDTKTEVDSHKTAAHTPNEAGTHCTLCGAELVCLHVYSGEKLITKTPTCTEKGQKAIVCSKCKANKPGSEEELAATGHAWDEGEVIKAASCKETGTTKYKCNNMCGETKTEEVAKTAHNYKEEITHATCTEDGYSTFTCTMCGSYYVDKAVTAYGHMFETYFYDEGSATCFKDGTKTAECANGCGETNTVADPGSKTDHEMTDFTVITPATCTEDGEEEAKCFYYDNCGYSELVPVDALGHDDTGAFETTVPATCTEKGTEVKKCVRCGEVIDTQDIAALGHDESGELVEVLAATCTAEGSKEKKCVRCSEVVATEAIPALGHDIAADYTIDVAATCLTAGKQSKHCSRCDYKDGEVEIPATGHDMKPGEGTTATCTEPGKAVFVCANGCGETKTESNSPALGHDYAYVSNGDATCTADGTKTGKCIRCDAENTTDDVGSKLDHVMAEPVIVKATKENGGLITNKCANCEYEEVEEIAKIDSLKLKYTTVVYDGKYKRPSLTITDADGAKLIKGEDYLLELPAKEDCINAGTYTYKVTFIGNYEGEETLTYKVVPGKASKIVSKDTKQTYISLKWSTVKGADGYRIYVKTSSGSWKKLATVKGTTSYKVKDLKAGTKYTFAVKAFSKSEDGKTTIWASEFAEQTFKTLPGKTSSLTAKTSKNAVKLTWKAVTGADGYRVYVKTAKGGWKTVSTVKGKTTYTVKDLKANTTYEYAVKAYYKDGSANIWSNQYKTVKAKTAK